jgi:hypothetical protein
MRLDATLLHGGLGIRILRNGGAKGFRFSCRGRLMPFKLRSKMRCKKRPARRVELIYVDQGYTGADAAKAAGTRGIELWVLLR